MIPADLKKEEEDELLRCTFQIDLRSHLRNLQEENRSLKTRLIKQRLKYHQKLEEIKGRLTQGKQSMKHEMYVMDSYITNIMMHLDAEAEIDCREGVRTPWRV